MSPSPPAHVLVVDDEEDLCELLSMRLEHHGFRASIETTIRGAIEVMEREIVDAMIVDLRLDGESGLDLLDAVQQRSLDLPVIMLTAHGSVESAVDAMARGAYGFLTKPFHDHELLEKVRHGVERVRLRREVAGLRRIVGGSEQGRLLGTGAKIAEVRERLTVQGPSPAIGDRTRAADVAPELIALIEAATALEPSARPASARALAEQIEGYLDGERDAHRRLELCEEHMLAAQRHREAGALSDALRELGRAIALVPTHTAALVALHQLMTELPSEAPPEAQRELAALRASHALGSARTSTIRLLTWLLAVPLVIAFGVTDWTRGAMVLGALLSATALSALAWRGEHITERWSLVLGISSSLALATFSFLLGPFIVVPGLASTNAMFFAMTTDQKLRPAWLALGVLAIAVPFLLGLMGLDPHYTVEHDALVVRSSLGHLPLEGTLLFLLLTSLATVITPTVLAGRMRDRLAKAEEKVFLQAWHLRHLLPKT